ncbi:hypothetical protein [Salmonella phage ST56]|nr:hypothetical protein [Salmonella phage ST56]
MDQKFETTSHSSRTSSLPIGPLSVQTEGPTLDLRSKLQVIDSRSTLSHDDRSGLWLVVRTIGWDYGLSLSPYLYNHESLTISPNNLQSNNLQSSTMRHSQPTVTDLQSHDTKLLTYSLSETLGLVSKVITSGPFSSQRP